VGACREAAGRVDHGLGLFGRNGIVARVLVTSFFFGFIHIDAIT
jgi:hypothetical protein